MSLPYEVFIGLRYLRARRRNGFISFISLMSVLGIALGVAALIVVLSVMNGFQQEIRGRMLSVVSHLEIGSYDGQIAGWQPLQAQLRQSDSLSPMSQGQYAYVPDTRAIGDNTAEGERLRAAVGHLRGGAQKLSASVGVAVWPPAHDPLLLVPESNRAQAQLLWMQAQQSLALARSAGRNCVRLVSDAPLPGPQRHSGTRSA